MPVRGVLDRLAVRSGVEQIRRPHTSRVGQGGHGLQYLGEQRDDARFSPLLTSHHLSIPSEIRAAQALRAASANLTRAS